MKQFIFKNVTTSTRYCNRGSWVITAFDEFTARSILCSIVNICNRAFESNEDNCPWYYEDSYWTDLVKTELCLDYCYIPERPAINLQELRLAKPDVYELNDDTTFCYQLSLSPKRYRLGGYAKYYYTN